MLPITTFNKQVAIKIATEAFINNPSMRWFVKNDNSADLRMQNLCDYCICCAMEKQGAFFSNDMNGLVLVYRNDAKIAIFKYFKLLFSLLHYCCGWKKLPLLIYRQYLVGKKRNKEQHLYVLLIASNHKNGNYTVNEMKNYIFRLSQQYQLPVYAETASYAAKTAYERNGFKTYNSMTIPGSKIQLWFLERSTQ